MQTIAKANSVPMLTSSPTRPIGSRAGEDHHDDAGDDRGDVRRAEARMHLGGDRRQQAVARHRIEDARLPEQHDQHDRGQAENDAELDDGDSQLSPIASMPTAIGSGTLSLS